MGVRGLTTYVKCNKDALMTSFNLHDTNLIIDGYSLCAQLNMLMCDFSAFGGNYDKFASYTTNFFKNLLKCNVTPHVIFDGCHETKKLHTVFNRLLEKLYQVAHLHPLMQTNTKHFPFLLRDVFRKVLSDMKIKYTICKFEADKNIASLARQMNCPVLSYDSDFFIYNVMYIPLNTLRFKPKLLEENGLKVFAMECKMFKVQHLCDYHSGFDEMNLPLLATLLGNDYADNNIFENFFSHLEWCEREMGQSEDQRLIHTLFTWLKNETLDSAVTKILQTYRREQKYEVFTMIKNNYEVYNYDAQALKYFDIMEFDSLSERSSTDSDMDIETVSDSYDYVRFGDDEKWFRDDEEVITYHKFKSIPAWFAEKISCEKIPPVYLNLYAHHLQICNPQAEDFTERDSFLCSLSLVRMAFDILTDFSFDTCFYVSRTKDRYRKVTIGKEHSIPRPFDESFQTINDQQLKLCFKYFLHFKLPNLDLALIEMLPSNFQLFMISILWWIATCSVPEAHVHSLIMSYITLEVIDEKTGTARGCNKFNKKHATELEEIRKNKTSYESAENELFLDKNKVLYEDCLIAASEILKLFDIDESIWKRPADNYDIKKIHSFAQFQCVLHQMNSLNALCSAPFEATVFSKSYNGLLIYNIASKLENDPDPLSFFDDYIKGATTVLLFYKSIYSICKKLLRKMRLSTVQPSKKRKRSRWY